MMTTIWWVRRDLRLTDNATLHAALENADTVIPLFILDPRLLDSSGVGPSRLAFLLGGLRALDAELRERGSHLIVRQGNPNAVLRQLVEATKAHAVYAERDHSPFAKARDEAIASRVHLNFQDGVAIRPIGSVLKQDGTPYTVFTPYRKAWQSNDSLQRADILPSPKTLNPPGDIESISIPETPSLPADTAFMPGEKEAKRRLAPFLNGDHAPIFNYAATRDRPDLDGTSQLSPYLRFGMISSRLAAVGTYEAIARAPNAAARQGVQTWLSELIWRDFYMTILHYFPHVRGSSFRPQYNQIDWINAEADFAAWCEGRTGYPFIDAAMRQLKTIGWMHNRARMAVASFLVKDLLIDWRWGETWFMQHLLDGDPAANNGGWQWSAGTGTDAAPYFRIFNPISQGTKFDPEGAYVRRWVPELAYVPTPLIHEPWKMNSAEQQRYGCRIGQDYPEPIVNHKSARERTLAAYQAVKQ